MSLPSMSSLKGLGRTTSSTSLAQFYHDGTETTPSSTDFCNAFWGPGDQGYEVLMARLRASGRTIEELKGFWKERAAIEEDYAKKLSKLAKSALGKDEVGDLRDCVEALKAETDKQAGARLKLANEIRKDVESPANEFAGRLSNLKKTYQANVEKSYKNKVAQEGYVAKARERYEQDCLRLNAYTANSSIVQGKELEKLQRQMEKVQASVGPNEREFKSYVKVLEETTRKWEGEWKGFCDHVQDLEEERLEFIKDNVWIYANAVSSVCVTDDESCERIRVSLENFESANDIENFVKNYGTGSAIPDPPAYVDYSRGEAYTNGNTARTANFARTTGRAPTLPKAEAAVSPVPVSASQSQFNQQGLASRQSAEALNTRSSQTVSGYGESPQAAPQRPPSQPPFGGVAMPGIAAQRVASPAPPPAPSPALPPAQAQASSISAPNVRPPSAYGSGRPSSGMSFHGPPATGPSAFRSPTSAADEDPVARSLANLRMDPPPAGSIRRGNSSRRPDSTGPMSRNSIGSISGLGLSRSPGPAQDHHQQQQQYGSSNNRASFQGHAANRQSMDASLIPPAAGHTAADLARSMAEHEKRSSRQMQQQPREDFSAAAEDVVGAHPASRPCTPAAAPRAPSPAFMQPPTMAASPVDEIVGQYHQAFPGERQSRAPSRAGSVSSRRSRAQSIGQPAEQPQNLRSPSPAAREGFVGIGAGNAARSPSPQPFSPGQAQPQAMRAPSPGPTGPGYQRSHTPGGSYSAGQRQSQQYASTPQITSPVTGMQPTVQASSRYSTYSGMPTQQATQPPLAQPANARHTMQYGSMPSAAGAVPAGYSPLGQYQAPVIAQAQSAPYTGYQVPPPQQIVPQAYNQPYVPPAPVAQPMYAQPTQVTAPLQHGNSIYRAPSAGPTSASPYAPPQQQQPVYAAGPASAAAGYYGQQQQIPPPQQQSQNGYARAASPNLSAVGRQDQGVGRSPSPVPPVAPVDTPPTGQYSTTGQPVLFYVKALYDYEAQSDAEFDFQVGDIIAVTNTPPDGWWSGELLDEARRQAGRNDFPSNFVCLF